MAETGWIKLHRKVLDCWIWNEKPYDKARAWVDLLLLAMHRDKKLLVDNDLVVVERGSLMTSIVKLANRWGWSRCKVMRYLELLESEQMLNTKRTPKGTLVTIVKYEDYQIMDMSDDTPLDTTIDTTNDTTLDTPLDTPNDTTDETQKKNIKNDKNDKNINNNIYAQNSLCENDKKSQKEELEKNFKIIYDSYPKKVGKARGFDLYKRWLKGRDISGSKVKLTNKQMWNAIAKYKREIENNGTELQYVKQFDTFMNKPILDYVEDEE